MRTKLIVKHGNFNELETIYSIGWYRQQLIKITINQQKQVYILKSMLVGIDFTLHSREMMLTMGIHMWQNGLFWLPLLAATLHFSRWWKNKVNKVLELWKCWIYHSVKMKQPDPKLNIWQPHKHTMITAIIVRDMFTISTIGHETMVCAVYLSIFLSMV